MLADEETDDLHFKSKRKVDTLENAAFVIFSLVALFVVWYVSEIVYY